MIEKYLLDLEDRIDPQMEETLFREWKNFTDGNFQGEVFSPRRAKTPACRLPWKTPSVNQAIRNVEDMALQQFSHCSSALAAGNGSLLCVRANYGTSILPSLFGAEMFFMEDTADTLPTSRPIAGGARSMERIVKAGIPSLDSGLGPKVFEAGKAFMKIMGQYPKIGKYVHLYHPDLQGPLDICELLWGSDLFYALVDAPDLVKALLSLICETYVRFMNQWNQLAPAQGDHAVHWGMLHGGRIMLRDDSAMNLSPEMVEEFVLPFDMRLLREFGGGAVHFCGKGDHHIGILSRINNLHAVNLSQPEYNDMEIIFQNTIDKGIPLIGLGSPAAKAALANGRNLRGKVHCSGTF